MTDPIRAALDKAAEAICICGGECFETRHGMMHGPCEKKVGKAAKAIAAFNHALPGSLSKDGAAWWYSVPAEMEAKDWLADAVLAAAKEE